MVELKRPPNRLTKKVVGNALEKSSGIMAVAAEKLKVHRSTISRFVAKHPSLQLLIEEITDQTNDVAESQLKLAIAKGEAWAVKYWLDNRGQDRGFGVRKMAFRDEQGSVTVPARMVGPAVMSEDEWEREAAKTLNPASSPTIN